MILLIILRNEIKPNTDIILKNIQNIEKMQSYKKNNINIYNEFFYIPEVQKWIIMNNIETISGEQGNVGKALNIISPMGLDSINKKPILYNDFNMNILPQYYAQKININIKLSTSTVYYFKYLYFVLSSFYYYLYIKTLSVILNF